MELKLNEVYKLIGKVDNINQGVHFCNTTIKLQTGEFVNLKLEFSHLPMIATGKVFQFEAQAITKVEDELVLKCLWITVF